MKTKLLILLVIILVIAISTATYLGLRSHKRQPSPSPMSAITNFDECVKAHYLILQTQPKQCHSPDGQTFTQTTNNETNNTTDTATDIHVAFPQPNQTIQSPFTISGEARGNWFFEASFPIALQDTTGLPIASTSAKALGSWMTTDFVPFETQLTIPSTFSGQAVLVLKRDNPSGLPDNAKELRIPVTVSKGTTPSSIIKPVPQH